MSEAHLSASEPLPAALEAFPAVIEAISVASLSAASEVLQDD